MAESTGALSTYPRPLRAHALTGGSIVLGLHLTPTALCNRTYLGFAFLLMSGLHKSTFHVGQRQKDRCSRRYLKKRACRGDEGRLCRKSKFVVRLAWPSQIPAREDSIFGLLFRTSKQPEASSLRDQKTTLIRVRQQKRPRMLAASSKPMICFGPLTTELSSHARLSVRSRPNLLGRFREPVLS